MSDEEMLRVRIKDLEQTIIELGKQDMKYFSCVAKRIIDHEERINICEVMCGIALIMSGFALAIALAF